MAPLETLAPLGTPEATDAERRARLRGAACLDAPLGEDVERWIAALRRRTGATLAVLRLLGEDGVERRVVATEAGTGPVPPGAPEPEGAAPLAEIAGQRGGRAGGPLRAAVAVEGDVYGVVEAVDPRRAAWSAEDVQALEDAASAVSTELALRLARREAAEAQQLVVAHAKVHELIAGGAPLPEVLTAVVESVERHDPSVLGCVVLLDASSSTLHPGAAPSLPERYLRAIDGVVIGPNVGTCGTAAWSGDLVITEEIATDPRWAPVRQVPADAGLESCWSMPIKAPSGDVLGTLAFYGRRPGRPRPEQLSLLRDWARVAGIAIERHRALERLVHDARHDALTGLPNRMATMEALEQALQRSRADRPVAVLFVDLDGLKRLNDTLGHDRADDMLREVAVRLSATVPERCVVGRLGGDEFVVVVEGLTGRDEAGGLAVRLLEAVAAPLPGRDGLAVTASIGIALGADGTTDARELLREADGAMYLAKRSGRDRCAFYEGDQRVRSDRRVGLQRELRGAETRGELRLAYTPVVSLATSEIVAVEAVPRWQSPAFGPVDAEELWHVAEETGTAVTLGAWMLRESCEQLAALADRLGRRLGLGVDVSIRQLERADFAHSVHQVLVHTQFPGDMLWLEIDEAALARPGALVVRALDELALLGVHLVIDHAGSGLCAPVGIARLPMGGVKMDRRLVEGLPGDEPQAAVAAAAASVARAFDLTAGVEGVACDEQRQLCARLGFDVGQGPLWGDALDADALADLVARPAG